jgi:hypothetical protein
MVEFGLYNPRTGDANWCLLHIRFWGWAYRSNWTGDRSASAEWVFRGEASADYLAQPERLGNVA